MRIFYDEITKLAASKVLYRVWLRTSGPDGALLVARRIDPRVAGSAPRAENKNFQVCEPTCLNENPPELEIDPALQGAFAGAF